MISAQREQRLSNDWWKWGVLVSSLFLFPSLGIAGPASDRRQTSSNPQNSQPAIYTQSDPWQNAAPDSWNPFDEMERLYRHMDQFFTQSLGRFQGMGGPQPFAPQIDFEERDDRFVVKADLPGMQKDQIKVEATDTVLNISGERKIQKEVEKDGYHKLERRLGAFHRSLPLPEEVQADKVTAKYENGVLEINLPKAKPGKDTKRKSVAVE